jgi:hypothetical protein
MNGTGIRRSATMRIAGSRQRLTGSGSRNKV